jgi:hypothetical protein
MDFCILLLQIYRSRFIPVGTEKAEYLRHFVAQILPLQCSCEVYVYKRDRW